MRNKALSDAIGLIENAPIINNDGMELYVMQLKSDHAKWLVKELKKIAYDLNDLNKNEA